MDECPSKLIVLTRREILTVIGATAAMPCLAGQSQFPADLTPSPDSSDAYGLVQALGQKTYFERVLRELGEPAILTPSAPVVTATFRLTEAYALRRPRSARIIFFQEIAPRAVSIVKDYGTQTAADAKPLTYLRYFAGQDASRLRLLIDDEERFWDAASVPPDWDAIACKARSTQPCVPAPDGGASLLEGRVGPMQHAILRPNPHRGSLVQQLTGEVY